MNKDSTVIQLLNDYDNVRKHYHQRLRKEGCPITAPQIGALRIITEHPGISISQLAVKMRLHITTAEGYAERLSRNGYLEILNSAEDRRKKLLYITEKGSNIILEVPLGYKSLLYHNLKEHVCSEEKDTMIKGLQLILKYMGEDPCYER